VLERIVAAYEANAEREDQNIDKDRIVFVLNLLRLCKALPWRVSPHRPTESDNWLNLSYIRGVTEKSLPSVFSQRHLRCRGIVVTLSFVFVVVMPHLRSVKELIARQHIGISSESPTAAGDFMKNMEGGVCWNETRRIGNDFLMAAIRVWPLAL
jgi:hypothetical protein